MTLMTLKQLHTKTAECIEQAGTVFRSRLKIVAQEPQLIFHTLRIPKPHTLVRVLVTKHLIAVRTASAVLHRSNIAACAFRKVEPAPENQNFCLSGLLELRLDQREIQTS